MKRIFTLLALAVLGFSAKSSAQKIDVDLGIKVGANFSNINGKYWENGYKANFLGGVFLGVNGNKLGVQLEGIFSQSTYETGKDFHSLYGAFYNNAADSLKKGSFKVNYLSIPVLLNIKLFSRATIQLGPQYSGIVSVNDKDELIKDAKGLFKSGSLDGVIGLQINLPARLNIGARYVIGFSDINNESAAEDAWKQRTLQVHIGYSIL